jgi:type I restriction enzyme R subunit
VSNFAFLPSQFKNIREAAQHAETYIMSDPRAACFHSRFALETLLHWLYRFDDSLSLPYDRGLGALLHEPSMQNLLPPAVFNKARAIQKVGNQAVHQPRPVMQYDALQTVRELHHICYWLTRTYTDGAVSEDATWQQGRLPKPAPAEDGKTRAELEALAKQLTEQQQQALKQQQERDALDAEVQRLRSQLANIRDTSQQQPDPHDYSEADTRQWLIDLELRRAGWAEPEREVKVTGMPTPSGTGRVDYVLSGDNGLPLAVVEAKKSSSDATRGKQQAKLYADALAAQHGQRPVIFYSNGYDIYLWDDQHYPPRQVAGFYDKDALTRLVMRRPQLAVPLDVSEVNETIVDRYYQKRVIGSVFEQFNRKRRKALLVMATGTGKTRTAIALVDALMRSGWAKRVLFLADRVSLVNQAVNAFKTHLPESSPVNLVSEKDGQGRVYASTYPTMLGMIDAREGEVPRFGVGHFDVVIIDEAHRSVYQKYGAIFRYFDALLVGLTATPSDHVDRNTYELFELEDRVPTDAYELDTAVQDGFLVPPKVKQLDLRFPREGIQYDQLSEDEQAQWESLDWGDDAEGMPEKVGAEAINRWLFNQDTVDKVLKCVLEQGHKVDGGDRLAKTIIFARNHAHAEFIEQRFDANFPEYRGRFASIIDNYAKYPQQLIDDFASADKPPHIAISVDMLDTGIDVPDVANLVFFKPVYSKIKFWQMIGRGTRLRPNLFAPEQDKQDFLVFDVCRNFDFFDEHPEGIAPTASVPLKARLFRARLELLSQAEGELKEALTDTLHREVAAMNVNNFLVREHREVVERFHNRDAWQQLDEGAYRQLERQIAGLPSDLPPEHIAARQFDLKVLRMQLALTQGDKQTLERQRQQVMQIASALEDKVTIPAVKAQQAFLAEVQQADFWQDITVQLLEDMRVRLRDIVRHVDKANQNVVYTNFEDELLGVREQEAVAIPKMTGVQYAKKVEAYLREHLDDPVIRRLRANQPLSESDLQHLETMLADIGQEDGHRLLAGLLEQREAPSLVYFIRNLVGMDRQAAQAAFADFLRDRSLTTKQMRFVELIVEQLIARGVMEAKALYEQPFSSLHAGGPDGLFAGKDDIIDSIFQTLKNTEPQVTNRPD